MTTGPAARSRRSDGIKNRDRLVAAARELFAEKGPSVALEEVASAAQVSRTTLYRHFETREALAATVFEDNVALIEDKARDLAGVDSGIVQLVDLVFDMQVHDRTLSGVLSRADIFWFTELSARVSAAFTPLLQAGREAGIVREQIEIEEILLSFPMAGAAIGDNEKAGRSDMTERIRDMIHSALFHDQAPGPTTSRQPT